MTKTNSFRGKTPRRPFRNAARELEAARQAMNGQPADPEQIEWAAGLALVSWATSLPRTNRRPIHRGELHSIATSVAEQVVDLSGLEEATANTNPTYDEDFNPLVEPTTIESEPARI